MSLPNGDDETTPQNTLSNWLLTIKADKIDRPDPAHLYQGCVYAWNAYRDGRAVASINDTIREPSHNTRLVSGVASGVTPTKWPLFFQSGIVQ